MEDQRQSTGYASCIQSRIDLSIDPGKHGCGLAIWYPPAITPCLFHAEYVPEIVMSECTLTGAAMGILCEIRSHVSRLGAINRVFLERPKHYPTAQQKGDQEDISELSIVVGSIAMGLAPFVRKIILVYPHEWKGQAPKAVTTARAKAALSEDELGRIILPKRKELRHNVWDAVAFGLSQIERTA